MARAESIGTRETLTTLLPHSRRIAVGPIAGRKTLRLHTPGAALETAAQPKPFTAARDGFSLNAAVACNARDRRKLERLCRDVARPAIAVGRLSRDGDGLVVYELKHPFRDGTTHTSCSNRWTSSPVWPRWYSARDVIWSAVTASSHRTLATAISSFPPRHPSLPAIMQRPGHQILKSTS